MTNRVAVRSSLFSSKLSALVFLLGRKYRAKFLPEDFDPEIYLALHPDVDAANADAAEHYISQGVKEGRAYKLEGLPDDFDTTTYLELHSDVRMAKLGAAEHYLSHGIKEGRLYKRGQFPEELRVQNYLTPNSTEIAEQVDATGDGLNPKRIGEQTRTSVSAHKTRKISRAEKKTKITALLNSRFALATPLCTFAMRNSEGAARITMVTDSIARSSLLGGVGTALIFCAMLANRMGASLRIATRTEPPKSSDIEPFLTLCKMHVDHGVQFAFAPLSGESYELDIFENDLFVTTSWWSTAATLNAVDPSSILYLLQEDERMFYPFGDDRHRCDTIMSNREIHFIVNTELLFNHLVSTGLDNITARGAWFEPAFPNWIYKKKTGRNGSKRKLFFYARPDNPRNMFYLGIEVIDRAIQSGLLDLSVWDVYLVGKNIPALEFTNGYQPRHSEGLTWKDYAALIGTVDLGLSLMSTPHPSYPPLDLVASGAFVVTNRFLNKQDLTKYSPNVICADLDLQSLIDALSQAIALTESRTEDSPAEIENLLNTDWHKSFDNIITNLLASD
ncbi:MAG: hypothetical protein P8J79_02420 [Halioglobus sp.]|nr:hypothetical protein [Halioglobus sp.]